MTVNSMFFFFSPFFCPGCHELSYRQESSTAPFPSDLAFKSEDVRKAFAKSDKAIEFFRFEFFLKKSGKQRNAKSNSREETTLLHVYFKNEFLLQYKRDTLYGINDFICETSFFPICLGKIVFFRFNSSLQPTWGD